jgi:hypothetical protein
MQPAGGKLVAGGKAAPAPAAPAKGPAGRTSRGGALPTPQPDPTAHEDAAIALVRLQPFCLMPRPAAMRQTPRGAACR